MDHQDLQPPAHLLASPSATSSSSAVSALSNSCNINKWRAETTIPTCPRRRPRSQCSPSRAHLVPVLTLGLETITGIAFSITLWMATGRASSESTVYMSADIRNTRLTMALTFMVNGLTWIMLDVLQWSIH
ncbi:hypothetical protein C8R44DRAFT_890792 [Mycena epipterygia]|nr:hypothetical protein C8R44DRAFT_890792 [Mycena epipterygia]